MTYAVHFKSFQVIQYNKNMVCVRKRSKLVFIIKSLLLYWKSSHLMETGQVSTTSYLLRTNGALNHDKEKSESFSISVVNNDRIIVLNQLEMGGK